MITTDFSSFAFTPNQAAAASLLDSVQLDPKAAKFISFLNQEPFANLTNDLEKITPPDGLTSFYEIGFSNANIQKLTLESRLDDLHSGSTGFSSNMKVNGATVNDKAGGDGKASKAVVEPVLQHAPENRWGVWVTGFGDFVNVDGDENARGYNVIERDKDLRQAIDVALAKAGDMTVERIRTHPGYTALGRHRKINAFTMIPFKAPPEATHGTDFSRASIEQRIAAGHDEAIAQKIGEPKWVQL